MERLTSTAAIINGTVNDNIITYDFVDADGDAFSFSENTVELGDGDDHFTGGLGNNTVNVGLGNDTIIGVSGNNTLNGGADNDTIYSGIHSSTLNGGSGDDLLVLDASEGATHIATSGDGVDTFAIEGLSSTSGATVTLTDFDLFSADDTITINGVNIFAENYVPDFAFLHNGSDRKSVV